jgi:hypothetical protein
MSRLLTVTFTTAAFVRSSSRLFEASSYQAAPKGLPSSFAQHDAFASSRHTVTSKPANGPQPGPEVVVPRLRSARQEFFSPEDECGGGERSDPVAGLPFLGRFLDPRGRPTGGHEGLHCWCFGFGLSILERFLSFLGFCLVQCYLRSETIKFCRPHCASPAAATAILVRQLRGPHLSTWP